MIRLRHPEGEKKVIERFDRISTAHPLLKSCQLAAKPPHDEALHVTGLSADMCLAGGGIPGIWEMGAHLESNLIPFITND